MARYFSVEETAQLLGTTDRTVRRMLSSGRLAGSQHMDKGKLVWRVHASKEILEKIPSADNEEAIIDVVDTNEELDFKPDDFEEKTWHSKAQTQTSAMAEQFWNELASKFMERIEVKDQVIGSLKQELDEKDRQLRLLPDLQKQAEAERKAAELKALEVEALKKQIAALDEQRKTAEAETERLKSEKEAEAEAIQEQLAVLASQLQELKQPWWKKWFSPAPLD